MIKSSLEQGNFTLLEDFQLESQLAVNKSSKTPKGRADVEVIAKASAVKVNMNDEIYNHLVNIHRCFNYENPEEIMQNLIEGKQTVMSKAKLISTVKKRGKNIKLWAKRYAVISGNYIYFYRESKDLVEEESLFLKDTQIYDMSNKIDEKYALELNSKFGSVLMSFNTQVAKDTWKTEIHKIVLELNAQIDNDAELAQTEIKQQQRQTNAAIFKLDVEMPEVSVTWLEMDKSVWIVANLNDINAKVVKPVIGFRFLLGIGTGLVSNHSDIPNYSVIATSQKPEESTGKFIEVEVNLNEKLENPSGDEINVNLRVGYLMCNYYPPIIKSLITRIRKLRYENEYDMDAINAKYKDKIEKLEMDMIDTARTTEDESNVSLEKNGVSPLISSSHN
jgi:hypothetical protein